MQSLLSQTSKNQDQIQNQIQNHTLNQIQSQIQTQVQQSENKNLPLGIESYLKGLETRISARKLKNSENFQKFENTIIKLAKSDEAKTINNLYEKVYQGEYPYAEMLDEEFVRMFIQNTDNGRIYAYKSAADDNRIVASGIFCVDKNTKTGYLRGLLLDPAFSQSIDIIKSVNLSVRDCCVFYRNHLHKIYTETRTAHNKAQFIMETLGCRPCALFPNKDIFTGGNQRETDCLDITYSNRALYELRNKYPEILPEFADLFQLMADRFGLPPATIKESHFKSKFSKSKKFENRVFALFQNLTVEKIKQKWNVTKYIIKPGMTKNYSEQTSTINKIPEISFIVTETVRSAEKVEIKYNDYHELAALLITLRLTMKREHISYSEVYLPAKDPEEQQIFLETGFSVFGYTPAWKENQEGKLEDCIIFGRSDQPIKLESLRLTQSGIKLLEVLRPLINSK